MGKPGRVDWDWGVVIFHRKNIEQITIFSEQLTLYLLKYLSVYFK